MSEFTCAVCHETFEKAWSDEDAAAEYSQDFPDLAAAHVAVDVICHDCWLRFNSWRKDLSPEDVKRLDELALLSEPAPLPETPPRGLTEATGLPDGVPFWEAGTEPAVSILYINRLRSLLGLRLGQSLYEGVVQAADVQQRFKEMCVRLREATIRHRLGLGGEKVDALVIEELDRLRAAPAAPTATTPFEYGQCKGYPSGTCDKQADTLRGEIPLCPYHAGVYDVHFLAASHESLGGTPTEP